MIQNSALSSCLGYLLGSVVRIQLSNILYFIQQVFNKNRRFSITVSSLANEIEESLNEVHIEKFELLDNLSEQFQCKQELEIELCGVSEKISFPISWCNEYEDKEVSFALHRFGWLLVGVAKKHIKFDVAVSIIMDWISANQSPPPEEGWDGYSISERVTNWILLVDKNKLKLDNATIEILDSSIRQQLYLLTHALEFRGTSTNNHLINNGRALFIGGAYLKDSLLVEAGEKLLVFGLREMFLDSGVHREGSTHYHVLMARTYLEILWYSQIYGVGERIWKYKTRVNDIVKYAQALLRISPFPFFGDISPDYKIGFHKDIDNIAGAIINKKVVFKTNSQLNGWGYFLGVESYQIDDNSVKKTGLYMDKEYLDDGIFFAKNYSYEMVGRFNQKKYIAPWSHEHSDFGSFTLNRNKTPVFISTGRVTYNNTHLGKFGRSLKSHNAVSVNGNEHCLVHALNGYPELMREQSYIINPCVKYSELEDLVKINGTVKSDRILFGIYEYEREFLISEDEILISDSVNIAERSLIETNFYLDGELLLKLDMELSRLHIQNKDKSWSMDLVWDMNINDGDVRLDESVQTVSYGCSCACKVLSLKQRVKSKINNKYKIIFN